MVVLFRKFFKKLFIEWTVLVDVLILTRLNIQPLRMYRFTPSVFVPFTIERIQCLYLLLCHARRKVLLTKFYLLAFKTPAFCAIMPFHV